ncbi:Chromosome partition protein Smc [Crateriforma conspicua]|uniref:Chromosome partition protein Smc n=1 Tax=Crateriforma conspicua TaxID=2527996 RepID=A0A5C6FMB5_9PLAN|nr:FHA domain-containing protein [Crateriforma conspicua]TWU63300.1 Chromosome partition protein Smc [Crateriforma conspicua]
MSVNQDTTTGSFQIEAIIGAPTNHTNVSEGAKDPAGVAPMAIDSGPPESAVATTQAAIEFRVSRQDAPTRRLRLAGARYTFGSGSSCSICLDDPSLQPLHAILIREGDRVQMRAHSIPIEINGSRTTEAVLSVGDQVRLGSYRFELLSIAASVSVPAVDPVAATATQTPGDPSTRQHQRDDKQDMGRLSFDDAGMYGEPSLDLASFEKPTSRPPEDAAASSETVIQQSPPLPDLSGVLTGEVIDHQVWQDRLRREVQLWRQRQEECERLVQRCTDRESELRQRESELWSRAERLQAREANLKAQESAAYEIQREYLVQQEELQQLRKQHQQQSDDWNRRNEEYRRRENEYQAQVEQASRQLEQSRSQTETATQSVARMRQQLSALNHQLASLSQNQEELEQRERNYRAELQQQTEHWKATLADAESKQQASQRELAELKEAKDDSDTRRQDAEARVREMTDSLQLAQSQAEEQSAKLAASESIAEELRVQIAEMQQELQEAQSDTARLRDECEQAQQQIQSLEHEGVQIRSDSDQQRSQWEAETVQLRESVQQLSDELAVANEQLTKLQQNNDELSDKLQQIRQQRDEAIAESESRPSADDLQRVRDELQDATQRLSDLQNHHEDVLQELEQARHAVDVQQAATPSEPDLSAVAETPADELSPAELSEPESADPEPSTAALEIVEQAAAPELPAQEALLSDEQAAPQWQDEHDATVPQAESPLSVVDADVWPTYDHVESQSADDASATADDHSVPAAEDTSTSSNASVVEDATESIPMTPPDLGSDVDHESQVEPSPVAESDPAAGMPDATDDSAWDTPVATQHDASEPEPSAAVMQDATGSIAEEAAEDPWASVSTDWEDQETSIPDGETPAVAEQTETSTGSSEDSSGFDPWAQASEPAQLSREEIEAAKASCHEDAETESEPADAGVDMTSIWSEPEATDSDSSNIFHEPTVLTESDLASDTSDTSWTPPAADEDLSALDDAEPSFASESDQGLELVADPSEISEPEQATNSDSDDATRFIAEGSLAQQLLSDIAADQSQPIEAVDASEPATEDADPQESESTFAGTFNLADWQDENQDVADPSSISENAGAEELGPAPVQEVASEVAADPQPTPEPAATGSVADEEPEDDSIEAYMNRLLQRVQNGPNATGATGGGSAPTPQKDASAAAEEAPAAEIPVEPEPVIDPNAPLIARSEAPEKHTNLSAMRELANDSARSAISRSTKQQIRDTQLRGMSRLLVAAVFAISGLGVFVASPIMWVSLLGLLAGIIAAALYGREGWMLIRDSRRRLMMAQTAQETQPNQDES